MSTSQATLLADFLREYGLGIAGTATSASTTTLVDASNLGGARAGGAFPSGSPVRITSGAAAGGNSTKSGAIATATGTITLSPAITGLTGTPTYVISNRVEHIDRFIEAINRCLSRRCSRFLKVGITDVPDGDFLGTTITDHWTISGAATHPTPAYVTLSMANGVMQRVGQITTAGTNEYIQSDAIPCEPLETRNFMVFMRNAATLPTTTATATLVLRDLTNGANITPTYSQGAATTTSHAFVTARGTYTVPAGCSQVAWRLQGAESGAICQFGMLLDNGQNQQQFFTQPHLATQDDFATLYLGTQGGTTSSGPEDMYFQPITQDGSSWSDMGYGLAVEFDRQPGFPLFYDEYCFFPALASDSDTTDADEELVLCGAMIELATMEMARGTEAPVVSRGRVVPTLWATKRDDAMARWLSPRLSRLRSSRQFNVRRSYRVPTSA